MAEGNENNAAPAPVHPVPDYSGLTEFVLRGNIYVINPGEGSTIGKGILPAKWRDTIVGYIYKGIVTHENALYQGFTAITKETYKDIVKLGYNEQDPDTWHGITHIDGDTILGNEMKALTLTKSHLPPAQVLHGIGMVLLKCSSDFVSTIIQGLVNSGYSAQVAINIIRFSMTIHIPKFLDQILYHQSSSGQEGYEPSGGWAAFLTTIHTHVPQGPKLFTAREEAEFAVILSVHANAKEFIAENYTVAMTKRLNAFFNQQGYASGSIEKDYLTKIFSSVDLNKYHDFIPKVLRSDLFYSIQRADPSEYPWRNYLYGTLMEWNGMALIRETHHLILEESPKKFLVSERYLSQIRSFMNWWKSNTDTAEKLQKFRFSWYINHTTLETVTQAKFSLLFSVTLKYMLLNNRMQNFRSPNLNPDIIPVTDLEDCPALMSSQGVAQIDEEYLALIGKTQVSQQVFQLFQVGNRAPIVQAPRPSSSNLSLTRR